MTSIMINREEVLAVIKSLEAKRDTLKEQIDLLTGLYLNDSIIEFTLTPNVPCTKSSGSHHPVTSDITLPPQCVRKSLGTDGRTKEFNVIGTIAKLITRFMGEENKDDTFDIDDVFGWVKSYGWEHLITRKMVQNAVKCLTNNYRMIAPIEKGRTGAKKKNYQVMWYKVTSVEHVNNTLFDIV